MDLTKKSSGIVNMDDITSLLGGLIDRTLPVGAYPIAPVVYDTDTGKLLHLEEFEELAPKKKYIMGLAVGVGEPGSIEIWNVKKIFGGLEVVIGETGNIIAVDGIVNYHINGQNGNGNHGPYTKSELIEVARYVVSDHMPSIPMDDSIQVVDQMLSVNGTTTVFRYQHADYDNTIARVAEFQRRMGKFGLMVEQAVNDLTEGGAMSIGLLYNRRIYGIQIMKTGGLYTVTNVVGREIF